MAYQVTQVVRRCEDATENNHLGFLQYFDISIEIVKFQFFIIFSDLSSCSLVSVPDAVYHLMRHTELKSCDLSGNVIKNISPKFAVKFSLITGM